MAKKRQIAIKGGSPRDAIKFAEEFDGESDRIVAIVAQAAIEEHLRLALYTALGLEYERALVTKGLIGDDDSPGFLSFSYQAKLAFCLGIIDADELRDLSLLARIRNKFAHATTHYTFDRDPIKGMCQSLKKADEAKLTDGSPLTMRLRYQMTGVIVGLGLRKWCDRRLDARDKEMAKSTRRARKKAAPRKKNTIASRVSRGRSDQTALRLSGTYAIHVW